MSKKKRKDTEAMAGSVRDRSEGPRLEPVAQHALGRELRAMYEQIVSEPVPERFIRLLDQLEHAEPDCASPQRSKTTSGSHQ
jgi:hypothetical protein